MSNKGHKYHVECTKTSPPRHHIIDEQGGRLLTNIDDNRLSDYRTAVKRYKAVDDQIRLEVRRVAMYADKDGRIVHHPDNRGCHYSLWIVPDSVVDLTPFWDMLK